MARLVLWPVAFVGGVVLAVTGCTGDPAPIVTETPSASVSATASPSPSASASPSPTALTPEEVLAAIPEGARGEDFASASEFAKFFVKQYDVMFQTGDTRLFEALSGPECDFCSGSLEEFAEARRSEYARVGGTITTEAGLAAGGLQDDGYWNASFEIQVTELQVLDSTGAVVETVPASNGRLAVLLEWSGGRWQVVEVGS